MYELPTAIDVCGIEYDIRSDYRAILDIMTAITDPELTDTDKSEALLRIFYPDFDDIPPSDYEEAIKRCFWFMNGGQDETDTKKNPRLVSWEHDFRYIIAPINRVIGTEIRSVKYLHWWTFLSAYMEIGDCTFAQIVRIREKKATGKKLDKSDQEWYRKNHDIVDIKTTYTDAETEFLKQWGGGTNGG